MTKQKKIFFASFLGLIIILGIASIYKKEEVKELKVYKNLEYGFEFTYPNYANIFQQDYVGIVEEETKRAYIAGFDLELEEGEQVRIIFWRPDFYDMKDLMFYAKTIDNLSVYTWSSGEEDMKDVYIIPLRDKQVSFEYYQPYAGPTKVSSEEFISIVKSFRLVE